MANSYFQFKQFRIEQEQAAMKVSTEACLLGAWVANCNQLKPKRILDIGTGTGLLALMLAQRFDCPIDAVEIDGAAAIQARKNFEASPWEDRLQMIHQDILVYAYNYKSTYDLIICNPPFFANHPVSGEEAKDNAIHEGALTQRTLIDSTSRLLADQGYLAILYPTYESGQFAKLAEHAGYHPVKKLSVKDRLSKEAFREISLFSKTEQIDTEETLVIKEATGEYSAGFRKLLQSYYLHL